MPVPALAEALSTMTSPQARANVIWALTRIIGPSARAAVRSAMADSAEVVRHAATMSAGLWRDREAAGPLLALLESAGAPLQRAVAEALGRIGDNRAVPALLKTAAQAKDRVLEHSLIFALIEIDDPAGTFEGIRAQSAVEKRAALIALDQMDDSALKPGMVTPLLGASEAKLRQTAVWIAGHHPEWGDALAGFFKQRLEIESLDTNAAVELKGQLAEFAGAKPIQEIVSAGLLDEKTPEATRELLLSAITMASCKEPPSDWFRGVTACLEEKGKRLLPTAVAAARVLGESKTKPVNLSAPLLRLAHDVSHPDDLRVEALAALPGGLVQPQPDLLHLLCANLDQTKPVTCRGTAAAVIAKAKLSDEELSVVADSVRTAGPLEITTLLDAFAQSSSEGVGGKLLAALEVSKSVTSLRPDTLQKLLGHFPPSIQERGMRLLASLHVDTAGQRAHLEELLASLGQGDIRRGQALFNSPKTACSSCHEIGYLGGHVGPDLTTIGQAPHGARSPRIHRLSQRQLRPKLRAVCR